MFGYICVNEQELKLREFTEYRGFYCGLCRELHLRYGRVSQLMLNYDLTFLALLLTGLYEPAQKESFHRCIPHPVGKHLHIANEAVAYAADMCVLLSWQKLMDDWRDERSYPGLALARLQGKAYRELRARYPRQAEALERNLELLGEAEREKNTEIDYVAGLTGNFLAEIFAWKEDGWQEDLRAMGFYLGKFIYLMDALEDVGKDRRRGNYNLFSEFGDVWGTKAEARIRDMLTAMMAEASRAFERLPILNYAEIIRNVLYSGVWCRYVKLRLAAEKEKPGKKTAHPQRRRDTEEEDGKPRRKGGENRTKRTETGQETDQEAEGEE